MSAAGDYSGEPPSHAANTSPRTARYGWSDTVWRVVSPPALSPIGGRVYRVVSLAPTPFVTLHVTRQPRQFPAADRANTTISAGISIVSR